MALAGFAGTAHPSATIDLIWKDTGTNEISDDEAQELQLNVILTAGPRGSEGAAVSVNFSAIGVHALARNAFREGNDNPTPDNTPSVGRDSALPVEVDPPLIEGTRVEAINSVCICQAGIGTGLAAGQSHQLGYVTFYVSRLKLGQYEIRSDADGLGDAVLDGNGKEILPKTEITFNSAFLSIPPKLPGGIRNRRH